MHETSGMAAVGVIAACFLVWGVLSKPLARLNISAPMLFVGVSLIVTASAGDALGLEIESATVLVLTELTLALVLFGDASEVALPRLEADIGLPARLLGIGLPLTMALGTVAARLLFPDLSWWVCGLIGAAVAPTDAALGAAIIVDERIPARVRRALNVESGLNDGIATPFVTFFLVAAVVGTSGSLGSRGAALVEIGVAIVVGGVVGAGGSRLFAWARRRETASAAFLPLAAAGLAFLSYAAAVMLDANGFVSAFVAGLAFNAARRGELPEGTLRFTRRTGQALSLMVWFLLGALVTTADPDLGWRELLFAVLALTVVRMVPVLVALVGSGLDRTTVAVVGWFGPRGLASVVFALLALDALPAAEGEQVVGIIALTVLLSVVLHGVTAGPAARYVAGHRPGSAGSSSDGDRG